MIQIGERAGPYEFLSIQGSSRIGAAYKVRNILVNRIELFRVLEGTPDDRDETDRFLREIKVHARLSHPNIVSFYSAVEVDGELVMTSEFFEATTLQELLEKGMMPIKEAIASISQILAALDCAHEHGVVHREVSPANILLSAAGAVKLSGFGLAKSAADPQLTLAGTVMGWLEYMSPEQALGSALDARTDIYSAGAVLYEMVTGQVPFAGKSEFDLMRAHVSTAPVPPIMINPDLPGALNDIILTALAKNPSDRFQTAGKFREALASVSLTSAASPLQPLQEMSRPVKRRGQWNLLFAGLVAFVMAAIVLLTVLKLTEHIASAK
jgi:serine/threonine protein kinase